MIRYRLLSTAVYTMLVISLLGGCAERKIGKTEAEGLQSMEKEPYLSYDVPSVSPNIMVDQFGYQSNGRKTAVFMGDVLPESFQVIRMDTGEVVYTGSIEKDYGSTYEEAAGIGDFSQVEAEGEYYIESEVIGRSFGFAVWEDAYKQLSDNSLAVMGTYRNPKLSVNGENKSDKISVTDACKAVSALLLAYELFPAVWETDTSVPALMEEAAGWIAFATQEISQETGAVGADSAWFAAAMAKFSYTYQKYDSTYATQCLKAADKAWRYVEKNKESFAVEERFYAAAELYRATGQYQYHKIVKELGKTLTPDAYNAAMVYGSTTYSATKRPVDIELCEKFIQKLMEEAKAVAQEYKASESLLEVIEGKRQTRQLLWQMVIVSIVDYVITNHEYATVIENHQHYLMGLNRESLCYIKETHCENMASIGISDSPVHTAQYMIMLAEMMSHQTAGETR